MARLAEPLMSRGGSLVTPGYPGGEHVVEDCDMMRSVNAVPGATARSDARRPVPTALLFASDCTSGITGEVLDINAGAHVESPVLAAGINVKSEESQ